MNRFKIWLGLVAAAALIPIQAQPVPKDGPPQSAGATATGGKGPLGTLPHTPASISIRWTGPPTPASISTSTLAEAG